MMALSPQVQRRLTRPWSVAAAVAAVFIALQDLYGVISLLILFYSPGADFDAEVRWEIIRSEWGIHLTYLLIGLAAAYVLRRVAMSAEPSSWPPLVLRAAIVFLPAAVAINVVVFFIYALSHDRSFHFFGFTIL